MDGASIIYKSSAMAEVGYRATSLSVEILQLQNILFKN